MITQQDRWIMRLRSILGINDPAGNFLSGHSISVDYTGETDRNANSPCIQIRGHRKFHFTVIKIAVSYLHDVLHFKIEVTV